MRPLRLLLLLVLIGAGHDATARTVVDAVGRSVIIPDHVERVFAAGPPASATVYVVAPDKLMGWIRPPSEAARGYLPPRFAALPVVGRLTGKNDRTSPEQLKLLAPDLILDVGTVSPEYAALADRVQRETGIPYLLLDGRLAATPALLRGVAEILGVPERGEALASWAERALAETGERASLVAPDERLRAYFGRGPDGLETGGTGFINVEIMDVVGLTNVAAEVGAGWQKVTPEQVAAWRPDLILSEQRGLPAKLATDPAWRAVAAVAGGRVHTAPAAPFGWIEGPPGPNRLLGLYWLDAVAYPGILAVDVRERTSQFYKLYYGVDLDPENMDALLGHGSP